MEDCITINDLAQARQHIAQSPKAIVFVVEEGNGNWCGRAIDDVFGYRIGNQTPTIRRMIRDFRHYEQTHGRTPFVFALGNIVIPPEARTTTPNAWLVHSTDKNAGESILRMRQLCSRNCLRKNAIPFRDFGRSQLIEPDDYANLINFGVPESTGPEMVVASKQHGRFCGDTEAYTPGFRFYFRLKGLMSQPNHVVFLGGHALEGSLALDSIDHHVISAADCDHSVRWTPKSFTAAADASFHKRVALF